MFTFHYIRGGGCTFDVQMLCDPDANVPVFLMHWEQMSPHVPKVQKRL